MRGEKGFALVLTLVVTALMVALAAEMAHQVYVDSSISRGFRDGQQASLLAVSGVDVAVKLLQSTLPTQSATCLTDDWAKPFKWEDEVGSIEINVIEEDGKINLNGLVQPKGIYEPNTQKILKRLGTLIPHPVPETAWDNLAAWMDTNTPSTFGGADTPYYLTLQPPYKAHKGKLSTIDELSMVKGFTPEMVADLRPYVTVYSMQTAASYAVININTASTKVLAALDPQMSDSVVNRVDQERRQLPAPFTTKGTFEKVSELDAVARALQGMLDVKGSTYRIVSVAKVNDTARKVEAVYRIPGGCLSWQEY